MNNINESYLKYIKDNFDQGNNFIEYFIIIGVKPDIFHHKWLYNTSIDDLNSIRQPDLQPQILSKFPAIEKSAIDIDQTIAKYCFPNGFSVQYYDQTPNPKLFSFILDNNYYSLEYTRKYFSCLICYESISLYRELYDECYHTHDTIEDDIGNVTVNDKHIDENDNDNENDDMPNSTNNNDISSWEYIDNCQSIKIKKVTSSIQQNYKNYYIPKYILLASLYPFFLEFERILIDLYDVSLKIHSFPLYKYIENIVLETPVPPRGIYTIKYTNINGHITQIKQNRINEIPLIHVDLKVVTDVFKANEVIHIINNIILETRVVIFSSDCSLLNPFIFGLISLLYPFEYQYQIITMLPIEQYSIIESITPFIIGINDQYKQSFFDDNSISIENIDMVIIDIDNPNIYNLASVVEEKEKISFPKTHKAKLEKELCTLIKESKDKMNKQKNRPTNMIYEYNQSLSSIFFTFYALVMENYSLYLNTDFYICNQNIAILSLFKVKEFISTKSSSDKAFYRKFITDTQIFADFLFKRMIPKNSQDKLRILLFDEKIESNTDKSTTIEPLMNNFTQSDNYNFNNTYKIFNQKGLSDYESDYFNNIKLNKINLLNQGVIINKKNNKYLIKTPIFPVLLSDEFMPQTYMKYSRPTSLIDELEPINNDIISKTHLNKVAVRQSEIENYIDICWILLWTMTFWYNDTIEKRYRFFQLLQVIERLNYQDMHVINLLFDTLVAYGEEGMVIQLYKLLIKCSLHPNYKVHSLMMNLLDKKKLSRLYEEVKIIQNESLLFENAFNEYQYRKRTYKTKYRPHLLGEHLTFFAFDQCFNCNTMIDINSQCDMNIKMYNNNELLWVKCPKCNISIIPMLSVLLGQEINKKGNANYNTSSFESIVLYSPLVLKENLKKCLLADFGNKMDMEELSNKTYSSLFWSSVWYFAKKKLPYDFLLKYGEAPDLNLLFKANTHISIEIDHIDFFKYNHKLKAKMLIDQKDKENLITTDHLLPIKKQFRNKTKFTIERYNH